MKISFLRYTIKRLVNPQCSKVARGQIPTTSRDRCAPAENSARRWRDIKTFRLCQSSTCAASGKTRQRTRHGLGRKCTEMQSLKLKIGGGVKTPHAHEWMCIQNLAWRFDFKSKGTAWQIIWHWATILHLYILSLGKGSNSLPRSKRMQREKVCLNAERERERQRETSQGGRQAGRQGGIVFACSAERLFGR